MLDVQPHHGFFIALLFLSGLAWLAARLTRRGQSQSQHLMEMHGCCEAPNVPQRPWLFGLDLLYESHVNMKHHTYLQSMQETFNTYGRTFQSHHLGKIMLSTIEPANIQAIVKTKASDYLARPARAVPLDGLVGHGILTADGEMWKRHRSLMKPSFNRKRLEDFAMYEEHVQHLLACIPRNDEAVDLRDLFFSFTINSATEHLFGSSCRSLAADNEASAGPDLADAFDRAQRASVEKFALGWADRLRPQIQYSRDTKRVRQFADHYVHKALKSKHERETDPEKLRRASTDSSGSGSTDVEAPAPKNVLEEFTTHTDSHDEIRAGLLHLMVGGRDTTASLLSNLWLCLARNPSIWRKLQAEISTLLGERPDANCLRRLPYLRQCIDESLRCHSAIPFSIRQAARDTVLPTGGGPKQTSPVLVKEGTVVVIPLYCLHRDPGFWGPDAEVFRPERWDTATPGGTYLPFLTGFRKCLGWEFAINTVSYVTIRMVQEFGDIVAADDKPWAEELGLSMTSVNGVKVRLTRRE